MGLHAKRIVRARQQLSQDGILLPVSGRKRVQKRRLTLHPDIVREILNGSLPTVPVKHKTSQDNVQSNGMGSEGTPSPERQDVTEEADTAQNASESSDWEIREVRNYVSEVVSYQKRVPGTEHWTSIDGSEYWDIRERGRLLAWNEANPIIRLT
ncbi:hypothetical protein F4X90_03190 [Candidatus Poribacteria bacterium]|nr:hypothetical protein [Bacteroidetes bacterium SB0668_bin_1]MYA98676.1 hypothetical protein [Candidatus Poribacteria bacterium]